MSGWTRQADGAYVHGGMVHDTFDPSRDGTRCVYGYWKEG